MSFLFILAVTIIINIVVFIGIDLILHMMHVPNNIYEMMREYIVIIFGGIFFIFLYNYFAFLLRAIGNSIIPLFFLGVAAVLNIILDILFVVIFKQKWAVQHLQRLLHRLCQESALQFMYG